MKPTTLTLSALAVSISLCTIFSSNTHAAPDAAEIVGGDLKVDGIHFSADNNVIRKLSDISSPWSITNFDIYYQRGNVGIGTLTPTANLEVVGTVKANQFTGDGSNLSNIWKTNGNAGTISGTNFIGTSDNQALEIKVNNQRAIRIDSAGNIASGHPSNVAGGNSFYGATVAGGGSAGIGCFDSVPTPVLTTRSCANQAINYFSFVGGGFANQASGQYSMVGAGDSNTASGQESVVVGGFRNAASSPWSTVSGGASNYASGYYSTVPGGANNTAGGDVSFAAGWGARVRDAAAVGNTTGDQTTFVWADYAGTDFVSTGSNQFLIRASGGVGINTNAPAAALDVSGGGKLGIRGLSANSPGVKGESTNNTGVWGVGALMGVDANSTNGYGVHGSTGNNIAVYGVNNSTGAPAVEGWNQGSGDIFRGWSGGSPVQKFTVTNNGTVWALSGYIQGSDIRLKTDIQPLENTLYKLLRLRGVSYVMKSDETKSRRIGVIAQELELEYPELVVTDDKGMKSVAYANLTPVLIEAIKTLKEQRDNDISLLKAENDALKHRLERLEQLLVDK